MLLARSVFLKTKLHPRHDNGPILDFHLSKIAERLSMSPFLRPYKVTQKRVLQTNDLFSMRVSHPARGSCSASVHINTHHQPRPSLLHSNHYPSFSKTKFRVAYVAGAFCVPQNYVTMKLCGRSDPHPLSTQINTATLDVSVLGWTGV